MAVHYHNSVFQPRTLSLYLDVFDRKAIEAAVDDLINLLDQHDGDPDLEEDDHSFDDLDVGEDNASTPTLATLPLYGVDQSSGPINEREALDAHLAAQYRKAA